MNARVRITEWIKTKQRNIVDNEELNAEVDIKHVDGYGNVQWQTKYRVPTPSDADVDVSCEGDKALIQYPNGLVLIYMRPGDRIEVRGAEDE